MSVKIVEGVRLIMGTSNKIIKCNVCGEYEKHEAKGMCKKCYNESQRNKHRDKCNAYSKQYRIDNAEKLTSYKNEYTHGDNRERYLKLKRDNYKKNKKMVYTGNKTCSLFLGVYVAERVLSHIFKEVEAMPIGNIGYDFVCSKGLKIDVKSSCIRKRKRETYSDYWLFHIRKNTIADHFLCVAFDNRTDLTPLHMWLIPSIEISHLTGLNISKSTVSKWSQYELDIEKVLSCCDVIKNVKKE